MMKLSTAERELIEMLRDRKPIAITLQCHDSGEWVACVVQPPEDAKSALVGIGFTFNEAWSKRGKPRLTT